MLRACYCWASIVFFTIIFGIPATILSFIAPDKVLKYFVRPWSNLILRVCNIKVQLEGFENVAKRIRLGHPVLIAPEGTRSIDGKLLSFKRGGFVLAMRAEVPVAPMVILGGKDVMPKGSMRIKPGNMKIKLLPAIDVKSLSSGKLGRDELLSLVKEALEKALVEGKRSEVAL